MKIPLLFILFLLPTGFLVLAQSASISDTLQSSADHQSEALKIKQRAESFLSACVQRDWEKASTFLSSSSPLILSDDRTAADDWLVGRLEKFEIWEIDGEEWPTAVVFGCAKLNGRGDGTFEFLMTLETEKEERKIYHFEIVHEGMESPPTNCSFRK